MVSSLCDPLFEKSWLRPWQAIELPKECQIVLNNQGLIMESLLANAMLYTIYRAIFHAYNYTKNYAGEEEYIRELLLSQDPYETLQGWLNLILAIQNKFSEARKFYESAAKIMKSTRHPNRNWPQEWRSNKLRKPRNIVPIACSI